MTSIYYLINAYMLDSDYNHTVDFNSAESQLQWFMSKVQFALNESMYQRKNELEIRVDKPLNELKYCNYLLVINDDNTKYFYFIIDKEYVNDYTTTLYLKMDLIQTYLFLLQPYNFKTCLIDRQHVNLWVTTNEGNRYPNPYYAMEDDGLDTGDYNVKQITTLYDYSNKGSYIITSSDMLGVSDDTRGNFDSGGGGGQGTKTINYKNGYLDEKGLAMLKSFEGYVSYEYHDSVGVPTIGYGVTQNFPTEYNDLLSSCTEEKASIILSNIAHTFGTQLLNLCNDTLGENWLNQYKFNALLSYMYQYGYSGFQNTNLWALISSGANDTEIYNYYKSIEAYSSRRSIEAEMFRGNVQAIYYITNYETSSYITDNNYMGYIPNNNIAIKSSSIIDDVVKWCVNIANDNTHGYDQDNRWSPDYDCSSFIITAFQENGVPLKTNGATYTGNMKSVCLNTNFYIVTDNSLQKGDILLNEVNHVALYIGDNQLVEASQNENGGIVGGETGDQTGEEIHVRSYYNYPWDCVLRYRE